MKIYNKLVRDNIPEIISNSGKKFKIRVLNKEEYEKELDIKLSEELHEYIEASDIEELADMQEIINAIIISRGYSFEKFNEIRENKAQKNGKFEKKLFLESVDDDE